MKGALGFLKEVASADGLQIGSCWIRKPRAVLPRRGAGKRRSVLLGEHDGEDAQRLLGVGRVFGPELGR